MSTAVVTALPAAGSNPPRPPRRIPPPCWTHEEALALIDAYRDKYLALRRGNLRAPDWEEVAADIAVRCPAAADAGGVAKPKTPVQCRHKIEKLRKRYRAEKRRPTPSARAPSPSSWLYFQKFEAMDSPAGAGARARPVAQPPPPPPPRPPPPSSWLYFQKFEALDSPAGAGAGAVTVAQPPPPPADSTSDSSNSGESRFAGAGNSYNTRSLHRLMSNGVGVRFHLPKPNPNPNPNLSKKRRVGEEGVGQVAAAIRELAEEYMRVEKMKMEAARERERVRMEMETKRVKMVLDSQEQIVQSFIASLSADVKIKPSRSPSPSPATDD